MNSSPAPAGRDPGSDSIRNWCSIERLGVLHHPLISEDRQRTGRDLQKRLGGSFQPPLDAPSSRDRLLGCASLPPRLRRG